MTPPPPLLLASTSIHRKALLGRLSLPFGCVAPEVDEAELPGEAPSDRALRLAQAKAAAVARLHPGAIVIGSDQVASLAASDSGSDWPRVLRKPGTAQVCRQQLLAMAGRTVYFDTALAVTVDSRWQLHGDLTLARLRPLSLVDINAYIAREPAFDCAGGFKCESLGVSLFESIETRDPTALIGLPLIAVCVALRHFGVAI